MIRASLRLSLVPFSRASGRTILRRGAASIWIKEGMQSSRCLCCAHRLRCVAVQVLALSRHGLQARGKAEESFLAPLDAVAFNGVSPGDALRERYNNDWQQSVDPVYCEEFTY